MLKKQTDVKLVKFISDKGPNSCKACLAHHGKVFRKDDPGNPKLPIHPNCRCRYEDLTQSEVAALQKDVQNAQSELVNYGNQIAAKAIRILDECKNEIRNTAASCAVTGTLQALSYTDKINNVQKALENKIAPKIATAELTAMFTSLQLTLAAMQKINQAAEIVQNAMQTSGVSGFIRELVSWRNLEDELRHAAKNLHYNRLALREQQLHVLPKSPEEAEKKGFTKASAFETMYHKNNRQYGNVKYFHKKTGQEVIFNENGQVVTDPENIGTFNYYPPENWLGHVSYDVIWYSLWGNSREDTTPIVNRIFSRSELWLELILNKCFELIPETKMTFDNWKQNLDNVIDQLKRILPVFE